MERNPITNGLDRADLNAALDEFEEQHDLEVLSARPYGSHAKNMAGPESDHDIMFIFRQEPMSYVKELGNRVGSINTKSYGYDFQGWNVDKFGGLLKKSNPQCMEFLNSPTDYRHRDTPFIWLATLREHANESFKPIALYYHYRDMAKNNYMKYLAETIHDGDGETMLLDEETEDTWEVRTLQGATESFQKDLGHWERGTVEQTVNRNLKVLRSILYARYVRETHNFPTMDFMDFITQADSVDADDTAAVMELLKKKRRGLPDQEVGNPYQDVIEAELRYHPDHEELDVRGIDRELVNDFIEEMITEV